MIHKVLPKFTKKLSHEYLEPYGKSSNTLSGESLDTTSIILPHMISNLGYYQLYINNEMGNPTASPF